MNDLISVPYSAIATKRRGRDVVHRWEGNPLITLDDIPFPCNTVFNAACVKRDYEYTLLLRVEDLQGRSVLALARSEDGFHFEVEEEPVLVPAEEEPFATYESLGIEDPRITELEGRYYILYTAVSPYGPRLGLARTKDFHHFERLALISEPENKDGVLFPRRIDGRYVRLDRPMAKGLGNMWISYSEDLVNWGDAKLLLSIRPGFWDCDRIGASAPPLETERGWLEIYHGVKFTSSGPLYRLGVLLLDLKDPSKVLGRSGIPVLAPREYYERVGDVNNVVFSCGAIYEEYSGNVKVYYGAADTCICVGMAKLNDLVDCCIPV
ncbi:MAG: glycoside hydrolase family 130 protein [Planctomycetota bacterium]|jgi:predicted GH43/DUF377 family glycosyl hydrolase